MPKELDYKVTQEWNELKDLLTGEERRQIEAILNRLDDDKIHASEIARILPEALRLAAKHGNRLNDALIPIIGSVLKQSLKNDSSLLVDSLYALIGPATRRAVYESLKSLMRSINTAMQSIFTIQGLKWRFEAIATGKSYAEVVIYHNLIYQVEQVFLIHKETGLLLNHVKTDNILIKDEDMVSGMLTAIQDFVNDSFNSDEKEILNSLNVGNLEVWIEDSPHAIIAAVIRGNAPEELRSELQKIIEQIHFDYKEELSNFEGNVSPFISTDPELEKALLVKINNDKKKTPIFAIAFVGIVFLTISYFIFSSINSTQKWNKYIDELNQQPGILVVEEDKSIFNYSISGLKDDFSVSPDSLAVINNLKIDKINSNWQHFYSLEPEMIILRAKELLGTPASIELSYSNSTLIASGKSTDGWLSNAIRNYNKIIGISKFDYSKVTFDQENSLESIINSIEETYFHFYKNQTDLVQGQEQRIDSLLALLKRMSEFNSFGNIQIEIKGHTDSSGTERRNNVLSWNRANTIMKKLVDGGAMEFDYTLKGIGYKEPLVTEENEEKMLMNRRVSFKVKFK